MVAREHYFNTIADFIDKPFVKVITGLRRSGKSMLLLMLKEELIHRGTDPNYIISINFESFEFADIDSSAKLYQFIKSKITINGHYYLLLDEIQEIGNWEKAVNAFRVDFDADIYITPSFV